MSTRSSNGSGLLYVLSQPNPDNEDEFHDWYDSEHGPLRLTTDFVLNGYRYRSRDLDPQVYLAIYDATRLEGFGEDQYTKLRANRSARERELLQTKLVRLDRRLFKDLSSKGTAEGPAPVMIVVIFLVEDQHLEEMHRWYEEEHIDDISMIPGWRRSRRFQLVDSDDMKQGYTELLAIHDFDSTNGIGGPEHQAAKSKPWRTRIVDELVERRDNMIFDFFHEFKSSDYQSPSGNDRVKANKPRD